MSSEKMEATSRFSRPLPLQPHSSTLMKQKKSGYEPSDTETEWHDSPWRDHNSKNGVLDYVDFPQVPKMDPDLPRKNSTRSPTRHNRRHVSKVENDNGFGSSSTLSPVSGRRNNSKSPFKLRIDGATNLSPLRRNSVSPFSKSERRRTMSSYKIVGRQEHDFGDNVNDDDFVSGNQSRRTRSRDDKEINSQFPEVTRIGEKPIYNRRSMTAPRQRARDHTHQENNHALAEQRERKPSPLSRNMIWKQREVASQVKAPTVGELNEMVASVKISKSPFSNALKFESTDSIGDIFFSRDAFVKNGGVQGDLVYPRPVIYSQGDSSSHQESRSNSSSVDQTTQRPAQAVPMTANFVVSRQRNDKFSSETSKISHASGKSSASAKKFAADRRNNQSNAWFSCMRKGSCRNSKSKLSPEKRPFDEASYIERALVVEKLRQFWADKHQPRLNGFICHKQEALLLKELVSNENCPHILFKGPSGSGKRSLAMALLREIYGDPCWNISHDLRYFPVQEKRPMQVLVPLASSAHHVELNVNLEADAKYALMGLAKEIRDNYVINPQVSNANLKTDYKVIVLYEVDQAAETIQHLLKWIMDGYTDACKLILCCEDDVNILESVKNRCKVIKVDAPVTHEIMEVLIQIARTEEFDLSMSFAAKIAAKSKQNLRKAIMALEACKAINYPFADDQPIPLGWEEVLIELAAEILADPSPNRLFFVRGKIQKLLLDFVHPKLILLKLVEQFLKGVETSLKREIYYWHAYYDKRLPTGTSALLKLEEFVAKFMGIYRKSSGNRQLF